MFGELNLFISFSGCARMQRTGKKLRKFSRRGGEPDRAAVLQFKQVPMLPAAMRTISAGSAMLMCPACKTTNAQGAGRYILTCVLLE